MTKQIFTALFATLTLVGCKSYQSDDGTIPTDAIPYVNKYVGTYSGTFEKRPATITLKMVGQKPVLTFADVSGNDILGAGCNSQIGNFYYATFNEKKQTLTRTYFQLADGNCKMLDDSVKLFFSEKSGVTTISAQITKDEYEVCHGGGIDQTCTTYNIDLKGTFRK